MHCQGATIKRQSDGAVVFDATELNGTYIKNLSVDTVSIADNAVTVPHSIQHGTGSYITPQATETLVGTSALQVNFGTNTPSTVLILAYIDLDSVGTGGDFAAAGMRIRYNDTNSTQIAGSTLVNYVQVNDRKGAPPYLTIAFSVDGWTGSKYYFLTIEVTGETASAAGWWRVEDANLTVFGVRK